MQPLGLQVDGGEDSWQPRQMFALSWSNPAGVGAVHYRLLSPSGQVLIGDTTLPWAATAIEHLSVPPTPGAYTAEVWLEDAKGATGPPASASLRFDDAHPGAVEPSPSPAWIGRSAFPYTVHLSHPSGPQPLSGIRGYAVSTDSSPTGRPCAGTTCTGAEVDLQGGIAVDALPIAELPEGLSYLHAVAVSGAGVPSALVGTTLLRVDKTAPLTRIEGPASGWSKEPLKLTATASDAASGMVAAGANGPFTAIRVDGGAPITAAGASVTTTVIGSGVHTVAYYARDAVGNVADGVLANGRQNPLPATAVVKVDREPPQLAFAVAQWAQDPELIEARADDRHSGLDPSRGAIAIRRAGAGERFVTLPTQVLNGSLRARWDSSAYAAGEYEFRATAYDAAGNTAVSLQRADGSAMRLHGPLKVPVKLVTKGGGRAVRYGRGTWFAGRALAARRTPLAGALVKVTERFAPGSVPAERVSTVRTGAGGSFGIRLAPGPSREVVAAIAPTATTRGGSSRPMSLTVHSHLALRASTAIARIGGPPLVFRGRVASRGAAMPAEGKVVQLQFRLPGLPWSEFRSVRTGPDGRFRYAYRFSDDDSRGVRFQFRAYAPAQAGWPFEPAGSLPVSVLGT
ncbi:MAG TPA: hypothetical protein VMR96_09120 [Solirubrobacterales bacterium]|nr:hypothetical protein [Solirubrobacterales bacterium]